MADEVIRPSNVAILVKIETTPGTDASPVAADAIPFEEDGYSYGYPFGSEESNEATGSLVAGAPLIVGQAVPISIRFRLKGANATYTASVKPPQHSLLSICGKRGQFTSAIAAAALTAGSTTTGTLGTGFTGTSQLYRGMPLVLSGGPAGVVGAIPLIADYTAGKVATLTDLMAAALTTSTLTALPANWTYAGTSPADASARATDQPAGTVYIYEDGTLLKFVGCRGTIQYNGETAKAGFATANLTGTFAGQVDAAIPSGISVPGQSAPVLVQGPGVLMPAFSINRVPLAIGSWTLNEQGQLTSPADPNTDYGFGIGQIGERTPLLTIDPLKTLVATRNTIQQMSAAGLYVGALRAGASAGNRWSITLPQLQIASAEPGTRDQLRTEQIGYRATSPGKDSVTRDGESILCFY